MDKVAVARADADAAHAVYEAARLAASRCIRPYFAGIGCPTCDEATRRRHAWQRAEVRWVEARCRAHAADPEPRPIKVGRLHLNNADEELDPSVAPPLRYNPWRSTWVSFNHVPDGPDDEIDEDEDDVA